VESFPDGAALLDYCNAFEFEGIVRSACRRATSADRAGTGQRL